MDSQSHVVMLVCETFDVTKTCLVAEITEAKEN